MDLLWCRAIVGQPLIERHPREDSQANGIRLPQDLRPDKSQVVAAESVVGAASAVGLDLDEEHPAWFAVVSRLIDGTVPVESDPLLGRVGRLPSIEEVIQASAAQNACHWTGNWKDRCLLARYARLANDSLRVA